MKKIVLKSVLFLLVIMGLCTSISGTEKEVKGKFPYRTFGTMGKELTVLKSDQEKELFNYRGKGSITHMWFGGDLKGYENTVIRVYVDNELKASIEMELFLGHGIGFNDDFAPWGTERMGNTGGNSGIYNTYKIPFGKNIKITAQLPLASKGSPLFWWIIRGSENFPVVFDGVKLPEKARIKLYKLENYTAQPLEEFSMCDVSGSGMLYQVTMQAKGLRNTNHWSDISYMESCIRAYIDKNEKPLFLSSGLEDYFLGTFYFQKGRYTNMLAGLTHFDQKKNEFSAYRLHETDPVFFHKGLRLTNRCGEKIGDKVFHNPPATLFTTYVWLYQW